MNITDLLSGSVISSIAESTGATEKDTASVLANALPTLVSAMASNASTKDGADSLAAALDHHTTSSGLSALLQNVETKSVFEKQPSEQKINLTLAVLSRRIKIIVSSL